MSTFFHDVNVNCTHFGMLKVVFLCDRVKKKAEMQGSMLTGTPYAAA